MKSRNPDRGRATPSEPQLSSPMPLGGGGDGGGDAFDKCPGIDERHQHQHHTTTRGLCKHLRIYFRHNQPERLIQRYGFEIVMQVLDELTEVYGDRLDAPPMSYRPQQTTMYGAPKPEPEIKNPAGFINRMVESAADEYETRLAQRPNLRIVGDSEAI